MKSAVYSSQRFLPPLRPDFPLDKVQRNKEIFSFIDSHHTRSMNTFLDNQRTMSSIDLNKRVHSGIVSTRPANYWNDWNQRPGYRAKIFKSYKPF